LSELLSYVRATRARQMLTLLARGSNYSGYFNRSGVFTP